MSSLSRNDELLEDANSENQENSDHWTKSKILSEARRFSIDLCPKVHRYIS